MTKTLKRYRRTHLAWRNAHSLLKSAKPLVRVLQVEADRLAKENDRLFSRLSEKEKEAVRKWLPTLNCRRCGGKDKVITGPPIIERCASCGLPWGIRPA